MSAPDYLRLLNKTSNAYTHAHMHKSYVCE